MTRVEKKKASDMTLMDNTWRQYSDAFGDYMSKHVRTTSVKALDARIEALIKAKEALEASPMIKVSRKTHKTADRLCRTYGWTDEDARFFVEDFLSTKPGRASSSRVIGSVNSLYHALMT